MAENKKLVIFDCDGTLVDTDSCVATSYALSLSDMGYGDVYDTEKCLSLFHGLSIGSVIDFLSARLKDFDYTRFTALAKKHIAIIYEDSGGVLLFPDVEDVIKQLKAKGVMMCVASNGLNRVIVQSLQLTGLAKYFDNNHVFTYDMVRVGKPAPDLFLYALAKMGYESHEAIIVEDSTVGVIAANAAKTDVVAINRRGDFSQFAALSTYARISKMGELLMYL